MCSTGTGRLLPSQIQSGISASTRSACCSTSDCIGSDRKRSEHRDAEAVDQPVECPLRSSRPSSKPARHQLEIAVGAFSEQSVATDHAAQSLGQRPVAYAQRVAIEEE